VMKQLQQNVLQYVEMGNYLIKKNVMLDLMKVAQKTVLLHLMILFAKAAIGLILQSVLP